MFVEVFLGSFAMVSSVGLLYYLFYPAIVAQNNEKNQQRKAVPITIKEPNKPTDTNPLLTLVIPAYNEEDRLHRMLEQSYNYLSCSEDSSPSTAMSRALQTLNSRKDKTANNKAIAVEWIVVSDGSTDQTNQVYRSFIENQASTPTCKTQMIWKLIDFPCNLGKGAAVQAGMLAATADYCLMVDADGATDFGPGLEALVEQSSSAAVAWGSRAPDTADRSVVRWILTAVFHLCVVIFVGTGQIRDTQCGFKLLTRDAAKELFGSLHLQRWAFDTELLFLANQLEYSMVEVIVPWKEVEGSKLHTSALNLILVSLGA